MLYTYRPLHCLCKNKRYCRKHWNKIWKFKLWIKQPIAEKKKEKIIRLTKDALGGQIMKEFAGLRAKTYNYLKDSNNEDKKTKGPKKCVIKRKLKFEDYKNCLKAAQIESKINHLEKNKIDVDILKRIHKK